MTLLLERYAAISIRQRADPCPLSHLVLLQEFFDLAPAIKTINTRASLLRGKPATAHHCQCAAPVSLCAASSSSSLTSFSSRTCCQGVMAQRLMAHL